jgi:hypothetical protein
VALLLVFLIRECQAQVGQGANKGAFAALILDFCQFSDRVRKKSPSGYDRPISKHPNPGI